MTHTQRLRFAILGPGIIASHHKAALEHNADLGAEFCAIGHYRPERFAAISAQYGVPCRSYEDILADQHIDAIAICTPSGQHADQTIRAARAGKHVIVEKPMALTVRDADAMIDACKEAGVTLGIAFQHRARPLYRQIHAAIRAGDLGDLTLGILAMPLLRTQDYFDQAEWRGTWAQDGGGVLMNQGIHQIDLLLWFMGNPVSIKAHACTLQRRIDVEDTAVAALQFESGAMATIAATTTTNPSQPWRAELYGTRGSIRTAGPTLTSWSLADPDSAVVTPFKSEQASTQPPGPEAHVALLRDFISAVYEERPPLIDGIEGRRSVAVVNAIYTDAGLRSYE